MALFGLVATYATCIARGSSDAPLASHAIAVPRILAALRSVRLLHVRSSGAAPWAALRKNSAGAEFIASLNALAFLALSYMAWSQKAPEMLWLAAAYGAALYLSDAIVRALLFSALHLGARRRSGGTPAPRQL